LFKQIDFSLLIAVLIISIFGALNVYSASRSTSYLLQQFVGIGLSLILLYIILLVDYSLMSSYSTILYWLGIIVLVYTLFFTAAINGANSWIQIAHQQFEPAGFFVVILTLFIAKKINDMDGEVNTFKNVGTVLIYTIIPVALIFKQPNLGMAVICLFIALGMIFISGIDLKVVYGSIIAIIPISLFVWNSSILKAYQKARITSLFGQTSNYQLANSKVGIGSGGILGKGFLKGTQVAGQYVPENHTDFIFSVVGEEWGIIGAVVLLLLYAFILYRILKIGMQSKDLLGRMICIGTFTGLMFWIFWNIGMTVGLVPISGIPLPFMSHGNSFIFSNYITIALVMNVGMRKKKINF
jgi:rod shape determining protein RodA